MFTYIFVSSDFVSRFNHRRNYVQEIHACLFSQHECSPRSNLHHFLRTSVQYFSAIFAARIVLWQRDADKEEINNEPNDAFRRTIAIFFENFDKLQQSRAIFLGVNCGGMSMKKHIKGKMER